MSVYKLTSKRIVNGHCLDVHNDYVAPVVLQPFQAPVHFVLNQLHSTVQLDMPKFVLDFPERHAHRTPAIFGPLNYIDNDSNFKITKIRSSKVANPYAITTLDLTPNCPFCTDPYDPTNLYIAFRKRLSSVRPLINMVKINLLEQFVFRFLQDNFEPLPFIDDVYLLFDQWLFDNQTYTMQRKEHLRTVFYDHMRNNTHPYKVKHKILNCKSFPKREFYENDKVLRLINSRSDLFKVLVGPFIHLLEKQVYKSHYFIKHCSPNEILQKIETLEGHEYYFQSDYSSFESSFDPRYVDVVECALWRYAFSNNPEVLKLIMSSYVVPIMNNQGNIIYKPAIQRLFGTQFEAKCVGARMSGEMWTSLANSFSNLMNMLFICDQNAIQCDGFVEGDDSLFWISKNNIGVNDFHDLGFDIKMRIDNSIDGTDFCGYVYSHNTHNLLATPEQIVRLPFCNSTKYFHAHDEILLELLRAKVMSGFVVGKHTPILGPLCAKIFLLIGAGHFRYDVSETWWMMQCAYQFKFEDFQAIPILMDDRILYQRLYNIPVNIQLYLEQIINNAKTLDDIYLPYHFFFDSPIEGYY